MILRLRKWLLAGLLVVVPLAITLWVLHLVVTTMDETLLLLPSAIRPDAFLPLHIPGLGVLFVFILLLVTGALVSNYFGKKLFAWWNALLSRIPVVKSVYSSVKQVSDTIFSDSGKAFRKTVLVRWGASGAYTIGFVTGVPSSLLTPALQGRGGDAQAWLSVYVPTTPNPTGGYLMMFKKSDCVELPITVDVALKYIVSMGVVSPVGVETVGP